VYESNGNVLKTTNYSYEDSVHAQLTKESLVNSNGQTIEKKYYYPNSYTSTLLDTLKWPDKFMIAKPVDIRTNNGTQQITGDQYKYNKYGQIVEIRRAELVKPQNPTNWPGFVVIASMAALIFILFVFLFCFVGFEQGFLHISRHFFISIVSHFEHSSTSCQ
jgi:hypothetical protein